MSYAIGFDGVGSAELMRMLDSVEKQLNVGAFHLHAEAGAGTDSTSMASAASAVPPCNDPLACPGRIIAHPPVLYYAIVIFVVGLIIGLLLKGNSAVSSAK